MVRERGPDRRSAASQCRTDFDLFVKKYTFKVQTKALLEVIGPGTARPVILEK